MDHWLLNRHLLRLVNGLCYDLLLHLHLHLHLRLLLLRYEGGVWLWR